MQANERNMIEITADSEGHPSLDGKRLWMFENFYLVRDGQEMLVTLSWEYPGNWKVCPISPLAPPDKRLDEEIPLYVGDRARRMREVDGIMGIPIGYNPETQMYHVLQIDKEHHAAYATLIERDKQELREMIRQVIREELGRN